MYKKASLLFVVCVLINCLCSFAQNSVFFNVKADVATSQQIAPVRWNVDATWISTDQAIHDNSCVLYVNTFGTTVPNGDIMFPWNQYMQVRNSSGVLVWVNAADWCRSIPEGSRICFDGTILSTDNRYHLNVIVSSARLCT